MLTGLTPPTSGDVTVHGRSLRDDLSGVRGPNVGLGVCPQTNVVFESLTVEEHLVFFAKVPYFHCIILCSVFTFFLTPLFLAVVARIRTLMHSPSYMHIRSKEWART
jgi:ABC-type branched-subunit amino acid transport system ATPase component